LNPHCLVSKTSASCQLGYAGMVDLARFERATLTFAESRSNSTELQVQENLAEGTGLEPASDERGSFQDYCLTSEATLPF
jgi:hypothetical protein